MNTDLAILTETFPDEIRSDADLAVMLIDVSDRVLAFVADQDDINVVEDVRRQWDAFLIIVEAKKRRGMAKAQATSRRLEVVVGGLILDMDIKNRPTGIKVPEAGDLKKMFRFATVVEAVIELSTNAKPASRSRCIKAIHEHRVKIGDLTPVYGDKPYRGSRGNYKVTGYRIESSPNFVSGAPSHIYQKIRLALSTLESSEQIDSLIEKNLNRHLVEAERFAVELIQAERCQT